MFAALRAHGVDRAFLVRDAASGLEAIVVIDDTTLGPAAGGIRTRVYPDVEAAFAEVAGLARAMTIKCALAGLAAGGGKAVVLDHPGLDRPGAFAALGRAIQDLGGLFRTAGDLGTTAEDLRAMASCCSYVHVDEGDLAQAVADGAVATMEVLAQRRGTTLASLTVAVQGAGAIGEAVARTARQAGAGVVIADLDQARAARVAEQIGARRVDAAQILTAEADLLSPCAIGGVLTRELVPRLRVWGIAGAANNILATEAVADDLLAARIDHVPDVIASAGAVIHGIGRSVMGLADTSALVQGLASTAAEVLARSEATGTAPARVALALAAERLASAGRAG